MSGFQSSNPLWDFTLPTDSLTTLPDDDFLAILQSQIANPNGVPDPASFFVPQQSNQDIPANANPKALTRLPDPPSNASPLTDSSPSPPSGQDHNNAEPAPKRRGSVHARRGTQDDVLKRKASRDEEDDDDNGAPPTNKSHTTAQTKTARRKSGTNPGADESRLLKRKEQNRAAQRAFRERKEKHVKDLEDLLAAAEAKNDSTQSENENLKEMLRRLQAENTLLKQAAFTFSVPRVSDAKNSNEARESTSSAVASSSQSEAQQYIAKMARKETPPSASSSQPSPSSLFDDTFGEMYSAPSSVSTDSPKPVSEKAANTPDALYGSSSSSSFDWMTGQSPSSSNGTPSTMLQSPFTIISSNPTYMSYRDLPPPSNDFSLFNSFSSTGNQSFSMDQNSQSQFTSFFPQQNQAQQSFLSPDILMKDYSSPTDPGTFRFSPMTTNAELSALDDLFGGQTSASTAFSPFSIGASPVSHAASSPAKQTPPAVTDCAGGKGCSKEGIAGMIAAGGPSTFVTPEPTKSLFDPTQLSFGGGLQSAGGSNESSAVDPTKSYQSQPNSGDMQDPEINVLCKDFASKARCSLMTHESMQGKNHLQELMDSMSVVPQTGN